MSVQQPGQSAIGRFLSLLPSSQDRRCVTNYIAMPRESEKAKRSCAVEAGDKLLNASNLTSKQLESYERIMAFYEELTFMNKVTPQTASHRHLQPEQVIETQETLLSFDLKLLDKRRTFLKVVKHSLQGHQELDSIVEEYSGLFRLLYDQHMQLMKLTMLALSLNPNTTVVGLLGSIIKLLVKIESRHEILSLNFSIGEFTRCVDDERTL